MWVRHRIDIGWRDLAAGMAACARPGALSAITDALESGANATGGALACLSVRTGWDLLLAAADFPPGSEVLMSALTIPHMAEIVRHHGLVPVPVDIDAETLVPSAEALQSTVTPRTKALLVAHLFGTRNDLKQQIEVCHARNLLFVEDCAQAFAGPEFTGHPQADVAMFSFGTIKTATALGGGLLFVRAPEMLETMRGLQSRYLVQTRRRYFSRLCKYAALKAASLRPCFGMLVTVCRWLGVDVDAFLRRSVRGFGTAGIERFQRRPAAPLLRLMRRRLARWHGCRLQRRAELGRRLRDRIEPFTRIPGGAASRHDYWVFPILVDDPGRIISELRRSGFDASQAHSLAVVDPPADRPDAEPRVAREMLSELVFLPMYPEMTDAAVDRLADVLQGQLACQTAIQADAAMP